MKKYFNILTIAAFAMSFAACVDEQIGTTEPDAPVEMKTVTVSIETEEMTTSTTLTENRDRLTWIEGDSFGFFTDAAADINKKVSYTAEAETYTINVAEMAKEIYAYYPWNEVNNGKTAKTAVIGVPEAQTQAAAGVFNGSNFPMISKTVIEGSNAHVVLEPLASTLAFNVYGATHPDEKVKNITFSSSAAVAGPAEIDLTAETAAYVPSAGTVKVEMAEGAYVTATGTKPADAKMYENQIYLVVAKQNYTDGTITVETNVTKYVFTLTADIDCRSCDFTALNLNLDRATAPDYNYYTVLGNYELIHHNNNADMKWIWNIAKHPTDANAYTVNMYDEKDKPTYDNSIIRLDYLDTGDAPMLTFHLPQTIYSSSSVEFSAVTTGGQLYMNTVGTTFGYDLTYNADTDSFDFATNAAAKAAGWDFSGLCLYQKTGAASANPWNWITPCAGDTHLRLVRNHDVFWNLAERYDIDFTAETISLTAMPGVEIADFVCNADWLHAEKTATGLAFTADENRSEAVREGSITVTAANGDTATINVSQITYQSIIGDYNFKYFRLDGNDETAEKRIHIVVEQNVEYESYKATYNLEEAGQNYVFNIENKNGVLSVDAGQHLLGPKTYSWLSGEYHYYLALISDTATAGDKASSYIFGTGYGFDLIYSKDGEKIVFDFVPNEKLNAEHPDIKSFGMPGYAAASIGEASESNFNHCWETFCPRTSEGRQYIYISKR